tara:strand:- start:402 stop:590 length:189 start_codon:yes stop_codon:yes gene_type:complete
MIELTTLSGHALYVKPDAIAALRNTTPDAPRCTVVLTTGYEFVVRESMDQVRAKMNPDDSFA